MQNIQQSIIFRSDVKPVRYPNKMTLSSSGLCSELCSEKQIRKKAVKQRCLVSQPTALITTPYHCIPSITKFHMHTAILMF
jgi:hypothetical protein